MTQRIYSIIVRWIHPTLKIRITRQTRTLIPPRAAQMGVTTRLSYLMRVLREEGSETIWSPPFQSRYILEGVPEVIDDLREWFNSQNKPECKNNKHALCCQKGGPATIDGNPSPVGVLRPSRRKCFSILLNIHNGGDYAAAVGILSTIHLSPPPHTLPFTISALLSGLHISLEWGVQTGSADHPACQFPENIFCCYRQDPVCTEKG